MSNLHPLQFGSILSSDQRPIGDARRATSRMYYSEHANLEPRSVEAWNHIETGCDWCHSGAGLETGPNGVPTVTR